jgi:hypothetical protein
MITDNESRVELATTERGERQQAVPFAIEQALSV